MNGSALGFGSDVHLGCASGVTFGCRSVSLSSFICDSGFGFEDKDSIDLFVFMTVSILTTKERSGDQWIFQNGKSPPKRRDSAKTCPKNVADPGGTRSE